MDSNFSVDYKSLYFMLFNSVTDALTALENFEGVKCRHILMDAQKKCEELYISASDEV